MPETYKTKDGKTIIIKNGYYLAGCDNCGWVGCSSECGTDYGGGDDTDVYCPKCYQPGADGPNKAFDIIVEDI